MIGRVLRSQLCGEASVGHPRENWDDELVVTRWVEAEQQSENRQWLDDQQSRIAEIWLEAENEESQEVRTVLAGSAINIEVTKATIQGRLDTVWRIEEDPKALWKKMCMSEEDDLETIPGQITHEAKQKVEMDFPGREELIGLWSGKAGARGQDAAREEFKDIWKEAQEMTEKGMDVTLLTFSDASKKGERRMAKATQAWKIAGIKGGKRRAGVTGGSVIHGSPLEITSTRAEAIGAYSLTLALQQLTDEMCSHEGIESTGWKWGHLHKLDNQSVIALCEKSHSSMEMHPDITAKEWMSIADPDIWVNYNLLLPQASPDMKLMWHRGHPEKRTKDRSRWTMDEHNIFEVDAIADEQYGRHAIREEGWKLPTEPEYQLLWRGKRIMVDHRKKIKEIGRGRSFMQFITQHLLTKKVKSWKETMLAAGSTLEWGDQAEYRRSVQHGVTQEASEWEVTEVIEKHIGTAKAGQMAQISAARFTIKLFSQALCTREEGWRLEEDKADVGCRMGCKKACGQLERETNQHILWQCTGIKKACGMRKLLVKEIRSILYTAGLGGQSLRTATALWKLDDQGKAIDISSGSIVDQITGNNSEHSSCIKYARDALQGEGLRLARVGLLGSQVLDLWVACGIQYESAVAAAEQITVLIKNKLRLLWNHAAEVLREDDKVHRPRVMKPRETMMDDIQEVLMAQAQAGVESWGEAETRLSNTTNRVRQQWVRTYREARAQNLSLIHI